MSAITQPFTATSRNTLASFQYTIPKLETRCQICNKPASSLTSFDHNQRCRVPDIPHVIITAPENEENLELTSSTPESPPWSMDPSPLMPMGQWSHQDIPPIFITPPKETPVFDAWNAGLPPIPRMVDRKGYLVQREYYKTPGLLDVPCVRSGRNRLPVHKRSEGMYRIATTGLGKNRLWFQKGEVTQSRHHSKKRTESSEPTLRTDKRWWRFVPDGNGGSKKIEMSEEEHARSIAGATQCFF